MSLATKLTYGQVKEMMSGHKCCPNQTTLDMLFRNCLSQMWAQLVDECNQFFDITKEFETTNGEESYDLCDIGIYSLREMVDECCDLLQFHDRKLCDEECGSPSGFYVSDSSIIISPVPDGKYTIKLLGTRFVDDTLYEDIDGIREWREIDLPTEFHTIFAKCMIGLGFLDCSDSASAQVWMALASQEFDVMVERSKNKHQRPKKTLMQMMPNDCDHLGPPKTAPYVPPGGLDNLYKDECGVPVWQGNNARVKPKNKKKRKSLAEW